MKTNYSELIYFDPDFKGEHGDFNGPSSPLDLTQRQEYLRQYAAFLQKCEGLPAASQQVVSEEETAAALRSVHYELSPNRCSSVIPFGTMQVYTRPRQPRYAGWQLYTARATMKDGVLSFHDGALPPVPGACYSFPAQGRLVQLSFRFRVSPAYRAEIPGGILDTTTGRCIELRAGTQELVKLQIYSNEELYARVVKGDPYHHKNIRIASVCFGVWHTVRLTLGEDSFSVAVDDGPVSCQLPLTGRADPDTLFLGGGMVPQGGWDFQPLELCFEKACVTDFFQPALPFSDEETYLGERSLPCALGTYANRDRELILRSDFTVNDLSHAVIEIDALDPGGAVYINGHLVVEKDDFLSVRTAVTPYLQTGINRLEIIVSPRAPEVLYSWHRHADPYNAWFCLGARLCLYHAVEIADVHVTTLAVAPAVSCEVSAALYTVDGGSFAGVGRLYLKKSRSDEAERCIATIPLTFTGYTAIRQTVSFEADLWSPEDPNLYEVRLVIADAAGQERDDVVIETGFRTIRQEQGQIFLNDQRILLNGALIMQFLPPYEEIPVNHVCPSDEQIVWQAQMVRKMNGNTLRLHMLGYGTNDRRFARFCDRMGMLLIWTTRCIDSIEGALWRDGWKQRDAYRQQMREVLNHPSIVMWEGSNEFHPSLADIDAIYHDFVDAVRSVDTSRLICPVSHLYYSGGLYDKDGCAYYNDAGTADQTGAPCCAAEGWTDPLVVRSAHTYCLLLGYGTDWATMRRQDWHSQPELFDSREHAYLVTEFAVIGRQDPTTPEAQQYIKTDSYELPDCGDLLDGVPETEAWRLSQAFQALCAKADVKQLRLRDVDGMTWCCLTGGANDASYLKPPIDFYGYAKLGFYALREGFQRFLTLLADTDILWGEGHAVTPVLVGDFTGGCYEVEITVADADGQPVDQRIYKNVCPDGPVCSLPAFHPPLTEKGYYSIHFVTKEQD